MPVYDITLLRHGESEGNANGQIQGCLDTSLSARGREQAEALGRYWQSQGITFDWIVASPLERAQTTARLVANALNLPVELNSLWVERSFGRWEGQPFDELRKQENFSRIFHPYIAPGEDGESMMDTYRRAVQAVQELLRRPAGRYLVVSHGAFLNMVLYTIFGLDPQKFTFGPRFIIENTAFTHLTYEPEKDLWRVLGVNLRAPQPLETRQ